MDPKENFLERFQVIVFCFKTKDNFLKYKEFFDKRLISIFSKRNVIMDIISAFMHNRFGVIIPSGVHY